MTPERDRRPGIDLRTKLTRLSVHVRYMSLAAANASARGQRVAIMAQPLRELAGFYLAVDCRSADCRGERKFAWADRGGRTGRTMSHRLWLLLDRWPTNARGAYG